MIKEILIFITVLGISVSQSFDYIKQGSDWINKDAGYSCLENNNNAQSPINLYDMKAESNTNALQGSLNFPNNTLQVDQTNTGYTIELKTQNKDSYFLKATLEDSTGLNINYTSEKIQFHAPSEHTINGFQVDLEMQIVCKVSEGQGNSAIVGFLFVQDQTAQDLPLLTQINDKIDLESAEEVKTSKYELNLLDLQNWLPEMNNFYHYQGSFTTPGCQESVNWYINKNIIRVNGNQLAKFRALWVNNFFNSQASVKRQGNNRPVQSLGDRKIYGGYYTISIEPETLFNWYYLFLTSLLIMASTVCFIYYRVTVERDNRPTKQQKRKQNQRQQEDLGLKMETDALITKENFYQDPVMKTNKIIINKKGLVGGVQLVNGEIVKQEELLLDDSKGMFTTNEGFTTKEKFQKEDLTVEVEQGKVYKNQVQDTIQIEEGLHTDFEKEGKSKNKDQNGDGKVKKKK